MTLPEPDQLQQAWTELREIHEQYLAVHDVHIPEVEHYAENAKAIWLAVLWHNKNRDVQKDEISEVVQRDLPGSAADQQVRHLKRDGWDIGPNRGRHKLNPYQPSVEFLNVSARKNRAINATEFSEIKRAFGNRCATCGATEGRPDIRYGSEPVKLQRGHKDPNKAGDDPSNIISQCQFCNRSYKNEFVFDDKGRVHAVANTGPVRRANKYVREKIYDWLSKNLGKSK